MRSATPLVLVSLLLLVCGRAQAQSVFYQPDSSVKVFAYSKQLTHAWAGGFNNPQYNMCDLNHDGKQDLVIFERYSSVKTFLNYGVAGNPDYRYAPQYAHNFPAVYDYMVLEDYNCDGIADLFDRGGYGYRVYKGYYNWQNQLCFTFFKDLFYDNDVTAGHSNAYVNPGDIPAIADVDNDGDLDFISYYITGGHIYYYKNLRAELGLPCDSIRIALKDKCWGKVYQGFYRTHDLGVTCSNAGLRPAGEKKTHSGNTPRVFDWDMDGDCDYLDGSVSYNEMTFLKNGRVEAGGGPDSMIMQDTMWQAGGKRIDIPVWPTAYHIDIDQDGKRDLLIAPNAGNASENYRTTWFYKNYTVPGTPDWRFQSDSFMVDKSIDLGTGSYPMLFDYNKDGKLDLFVGSDGYRQPSGQLRSRLSLYLNTGTAGNGAFTLQTTDFAGWSSHAFAGAAPATGDIDFDGKSDMLIGHTDGTLSYFKNIAGADNVQPDWQLMQVAMTDETGAVINVDGNAAPFIYDIDRDGKKDLIIGGLFGYLHYYRNVATTAGSLKLRLINTTLGDARVDPLKVIGNYSTPFIGRIDSSGQDYLLMGSNSGLISQFTGFQSGDTTATYTLVTDKYSYIDTMYSMYLHPSQYYGIYGDHRTALTIGDVDNSGQLTMIVGNDKGGLEFYKRKLYTADVPPVVSQAAKVLVYPNPANSVINVSWDGMLGTDVEISVVNVEGRRFHTQRVSANYNHVQIPVDGLPSGLYICLVQNGVNKYYSKFTVVR
ncbi:MAG: T9SS type A sorting domain-containing protein [Bacteroidota bacterium]